MIKKDFPRSWEALFFLRLFISTPVALSEPFYRLSDIQ